MIGQPTGWTRHSSNNQIVLVPPSGIATGAIRYDERKTPLASAGAILEAEFARERSFRIERAGEWERLVTIEGEYAAAITIHGTVDDKPVQRDIGIVFLDDAYALTAGYCLDPDQFAVFAAWVRELTRGDSHFLGIRRRRFEYVAPADWTVQARGFATEWLAPDHRRDRTMITVFPAMPNRIVSAEAWVDQVAVAIGSQATRETVGLHGLAGHLLAYQHDGLTHRLIAVEDDRYTYAMRLDAEGSAHDETFKAVVRSLQPIPLCARQVRPHSEVAHWVD